MKRPATVVDGSAIACAATVGVDAEVRTSAATSASAAFARFHAPGSASASGMRRPSSTSVSPSSRCGGVGLREAARAGSRTGRPTSRAAPRSSGTSRRRCASRARARPTSSFAGLGGPHDVRVGRVRDDRELGVRLGDPSPRVADRVHLAVAVELVAAQVAEHEQLGARAGRRRVAATRSSTSSTAVPGPRARREGRRDARRCRFAPVEFVTSGRPSAPTAAASRRVVVVLPFVADTSATCWSAASSASRSGAIAFITRPLIVAPWPAAGDAREPSGGAAGGDREPGACGRRHARPLAPVGVDPVRDARARSARRSSGCVREHVRGPRRARARARRRGAPRRGSPTRTGRRRPAASSTCSWRNVASMSGPKPGGRPSALSDQRSWSRHGARFSTRSMIDHSASTQSTERSRAFQTSPSRPPGRSDPGELGERARRRRTSGRPARR